MLCRGGGEEGLRDLDLEEEPSLLPEALPRLSMAGARTRGRFLLPPGGGVWRWAPGRRLPFPGGSFWPGSSSRDVS